MSVTNNETLQRLKELGAYAEQVLLNTLRDSMRVPFIEEKAAVLEILEVYLVDMIAIAQRLNPEDPRLFKIGNEAQLRLYREDRHFKLMTNYRQKTLDLDNRLTSVRQQLRERETHIEELSNRDKVNQSMLDEFRKHEHLITIKRSGRFDDATRTPPIVVLCGSTRFYETYDEICQKYTLDGWIVLSIGSHRKSDKEVFREDKFIVSEGSKFVEEIESKKAELDELHLRKIDLADLVYIINKDQYIGDSTRSEIEYAQSKMKSIQYMEDPKLKVPIPKIGFMPESTEGADPIRPPAHPGIDTPVQEFPMEFEVEEALHHEFAPDRPGSIPARWEVPASPSQAPEIKITSVDNRVRVEGKLHGENCNPPEGIFSPFCLACAEEEGEEPRSPEVDYGKKKDCPDDCQVCNDGEEHDDK